MPKIVPIRDLKNTSEISLLCHSQNEPVFVTKNGYGDMVLMSIELYEKTAFMQDVFLKLNEAEEECSAGKIADARDAVTSLRMSHDIQS